VSAATLTLYLRYGCGLCEEMLAGLRPLQQELGFGLEIVEIDEDPELESRYGILVPVLSAAEGEICHYHLDPEKIRHYFAGH